MTDKPKLEWNEIEEVSINKRNELNPEFIHLLVSIKLSNKNELNEITNQIDREKINIALNLCNDQSNFSWIFMLKYDYKVDNCSY